MSALDVVLCGALCTGVLWLTSTCGKELHGAPAFIVAGRFEGKWEVVERDRAEAESMTPDRTSLEIGISDRSRLRGDYHHHPDVFSDWPEELATGVLVWDGDCAMPYEVGYSNGFRIRYTEERVGERAPRESSFSIFLSAFRNGNEYSNPGRDELFLYFPSGTGLTYQRGD